MTQQFLVSLNERMREKEKLEKNVYIKKKKEESDGQPWVIGVAQLDLERTQCLRELPLSSTGSERRNGIGFSYLSPCQLQTSKTWKSISASL